MIQKDSHMDFYIDLYAHLYKQMLPHGCLFSRGMEQWASRVTNTMPPP